MPFLDVSDIIADPMFADTISVTQRAETVNTHGETVMTPTVTDNVTAVVTPNNDIRTERDEDRTLAAKGITVVTTFRLQGARQGFQPDLVSWNGNTYQVVSVEDWTRFGGGHVQADCTMIDYLPAVLT